MRREGFWIQAETGEAFEIDDHAAWIRREANARRAGLPKEVLRRIQAVPYAYQDGPERHRILLEAMAHGLIRVRGHEDFVAVETTRPLPEILPPLLPFLEWHLGPLSWVKIHQVLDWPAPNAMDSLKG